MPVAARKLRSASSVPDMTSGRTPRMDSTPSSNSSLLSASRVAEVATKRRPSIRQPARTAANSRDAAYVRSSASGANRCVRSTPCPKRTTRSIRGTTSSIRPSGWTLATLSRIEFVPQSIPATVTESDTIFFLSPRLHHDMRPRDTSSCDMHRTARSDGAQSSASRGHRHTVGSNSSRIDSNARSPMGLTPGPITRLWATRA
ncbi:hypothetical protein BMIN_1361 [Bifidobacterium minimum]|uniref:Uncharacterized protein n=1 Tax=Bifidobacterium minimum TaxID=1693 RepID=A0A087BQG6_9BIFI|nr:hypothetical protein BMIN_1361 [Bifidobacterium minimum]